MMAGCGGGGGGAPVTGGGNNTSVGTLQAQVSLAGAEPSDLQVTIDGQPSTAPVGTDGSITVPGLPPGDHVLDVMQKDGMKAGRAAFTIVGGSIATIRVPIPLDGAGQIVGMVVKLENGTPTPMANVEVTARGDLAIITNGGETTVGLPGAPSMPLIWPPPPGVTYSAFTDTDGTYQMKGVKPGPYLVSVVVPGFTPQYAWVMVQAFRTAVADFMLKPQVTPGTGAVEGTVTGAQSDGSTAPIDGATVIIAMNTPWVPPAPPPVPMMSAGTAATTDPIMPPPDVRLKVFRTVTDANGYYSLKVPSGNGKAVAWAMGFAPSAQAITIQPDVTTTVNFLLKAVELPPMPPIPPGPPGTV
jgi:hypothetical protein